MEGIRSFFEVQHAPWRMDASRACSWS